MLAREAASKAAYLTLAQHLSLARKQAAEALSAAVTEAMQGLSMAGGSFVAALNPLDEGQSYGLEQVEFLVAGHAASVRGRWPASHRAANWPVSAWRSP